LIVDIEADLGVSLTPRNVSITLLCLLATNFLS
jgi:hypothetical protein